MNLPQDILQKIALELAIDDLVNFCKINKRVYNTIYKNDIFWHNKISKDFPYIKILNNTNNKQKCSELSKYRLKIIKNIYLYGVDYTIIYSHIHNDTEIYTATVAKYYKDSSPTCSVITSSRYYDINTARNVANIYIILADILEDIEKTYPELPDHLKSYVNLY